jgi:hypothetical protein
LKEDFMIVYYHHGDGHDEGHDDDGGSCNSFKLAKLDVHFDPYSFRLVVEESNFRRFRRQLNFTEQSLAAKII